MRRTTLMLLALSLVSLAVAASAAARSNDTKLSLVGYAVPREALGAVIKAWQQTPDRRRSASRSRTARPETRHGGRGGVEGGRRPAVDRARRRRPREGRVRRRDVEPPVEQGIATNSVVVFAVRDGNPRRSSTGATWPGRTWTSSRPARSRRCRKWNILAAYGAQRRLGKSDRQATTFVERCSDVVSLDSSGRNATNTSSPAAATSSSRTRTKRACEARVRDPAPDAPDRGADRGDEDEREPRRREHVHPFTKTAQAQRIFAQYGFRPVGAAVQGVPKQYPDRPGVF